MLQTHILNTLLHVLGRATQKMGILDFRDEYALSIAVCIITIICLASISHWFTSGKRNLQNSPSSSQSEGNSSNKKPLSALQQHVLFWDRDNDNIIYPQDVYNGFREIGFSIPFALTALLIPIFFSYPTRLGHSYLPDPLFRIYVDSIHKAKHGSDTGAYDLKGNFRPQFFDAMFSEFDPTGTGGLGAMDLWRMICNNRVAADVAGWSFAAMEWSTTWLLLQRDGRVWKDDLRQCYDGTIFWQLRQEGIDGVQPTRGYGWKEGFRDTFGRLPYKLKNSAAKS
jgi:peroxygenase